MGSWAFVRGEKRLRKARPGNDPIFYHFKEAFVGFAESQKEEHQFNPITSFPWCCVAKIKIKPPLFNGQKAKPYNLPSRRRQCGTPVSGLCQWCALTDWSRVQSCKSRDECGGKGNSHFLARYWRQGKSGISGFLLLPRKGSELPPRLVPWHLPCILLKWHPRFVAK